VGETTSDVSKIIVYVTVYKGYIYAHSNFQTPGSDFPTKLATNKRIDGLNLLYNLVGEDVVSEDRLRKVYEKDVTFIVDRGAFEGSPLNVDFDGAKRVYSLEEYERLRNEERDRIERDRKEANEKAAAEQRRREAEAARLAAAKKKEREDAFTSAVTFEMARAKADVSRMDQIKNLTARSTDQMHLFEIAKREAGVEVLCESGSLFLYRDEIEKLRSGTALADDHPLSRWLGSAQARNGAVVLYTAGVRVDNVALADEMAFLFQKAYHRTRVYRDPFSDRTDPMVAKLNLFKAAPENVVTIVADKDAFEVTDWKIIQNVSPELVKKGFAQPVVVGKDVPAWSGGREKAVTVITGHINEQLVAFVGALGKAGYFKDNYVLLNTCNEMPTRDLATAISEQHGALGVFCYDTRIKAGDVEDFVLALAQAIKDKPGKPLTDLINETISGHKLNGVWTLCFETLWCPGRLICTITKCDDARAN
jgi:hypothetical protein